ncbi:MAG: polyphosphate polymerase domain-containing protein [Oscillospiraceae bacterium]|nr:polyphosphate polymerase domain-containing protein [Oscillospiraceae bacterium]
MNENKQMKYRHELKYEITGAQLQLLKSRITNLIPSDSHAGPGGAYTIRSLYFDDQTDRCLRENEDGTDPREKFRIRIYNASTDRIMLECKRKERGKTHKSSCRLTLEQTKQLMEGRPLPDLASQPPVLRKLTLQMLTRRMRPVVIVEYDRIPYVYKNGNVRITLDTNIRSCSNAAVFLDPVIPNRPVQALGQQLLEVKYDEYLPDFIYRNLQLHSLRQTAFSKYYICRKYTR